MFFVSLPGCGRVDSVCCPGLRVSQKLRASPWAFEDMSSTPCKGSSMMVLPLRGVLDGLPCSLGRCPGLAVWWSFRPPITTRAKSPRRGRHNTGRGATPAQREWIKQNPEGVTECVPLIVCRPFWALVCRPQERGLHPRLWSFSPSDFWPQATQESYWGIGITNQTS